MAHFRVPSIKSKVGKLCITHWQGLRVKSMLEAHRAVYKHDAAMRDKLLRIKQKGPEMN